MLSQIKILDELHQRVKIALFELFYYIEEILEVIWKKLICLLRKLIHRIWL
jgi:hypothetical protein